MSISENTKPTLVGLRPVELEQVFAFSEILAEARSAETLPWDSARISLYRTIFPQMTLWLPDEEGAQLRFEFEEELERLEAA